MKVFSWFRNYIKEQDIEGTADFLKDAAIGHLSAPMYRQAAESFMHIADTMCKNKTTGVVDLGLVVFAKREISEGRFEILSKIVTPDERIEINRISGFRRKAAFILEQLELDNLPSLR